MARGRARERPREWHKQRQRQYRRDVLPSQPDYRSDITIFGEKYLLAGWLKQGKKGKNLSIVARPDEQDREQAPQERAGDAIPF